MTLECGSGVFVAENFGLAAGQDQTVQTGFVDDVDRLRVEIANLLILSTLHIMEGGKINNLPFVIIQLGNPAASHQALSAKRQEPVICSTCSTLPSRGKVGGASPPPCGCPQEGLQNLQAGRVAAGLADRREYVPINPLLEGERLGLVATAHEEIQALLGQGQHVLFTARGIIPNNTLPLIGDMIDEVGVPSVFQRLRELFPQWKQFQVSTAWRRASEVVGVSPPPCGYPQGEQGIDCGWSTRRFWRG